MGIVLRFAALKIFLPLLLLGGKLFGSEEKAERFVVRMNNRLLPPNRKVEPCRLLLLTPHCLQNSRCSSKIVEDVNNCQGCGNCKIKDLREMAGHYSINLSVVSGGILARKILKESPSAAVVAVACERELSNGICDSFPLPVLGIPNVCPCGPCKDTDVDLSSVEDGIKFLVE